MTTREERKANITIMLEDIELEIMKIDHDDYTTLKAVEDLIEDLQRRIEDLT